ncbi:MAG: molybdopterin molybdotransferase MoeA [Deltaproteobacteria bacterium]|nr:MAG: molybdopterin molybdotransferase MoeA [Deltaproteobacteria bacterium]
MVSIEEARRRILAQVRPIGTEKVDILSAVGRVLAKDIKSALNMPPFDNAAMDGYAVISKDTKGASPGNPRVLKILEDLPAGAVPKFRVTPGTTSQIMTGAQMPKGADAVMMVEDTRRSGDKVNVLCEIKPKKNVRFAGEDFKKGKIVLRKGTLLRPPHLSALATQGIKEVPVYRRPRVAILSTGSELIDIKQPLRPGKIRESNSYSLFAQVLSLNAEPILLGIAGDREKDLRRHITGGLKKADVLLTSGGVSVGKYDMVKDVLKDLGMKLHFWQVAVKPGKPLMFGTINKHPIFGLPGNPVSSMVSFENFVRPALLKLMGRQDLFRPPVKAILTHKIKKKAGRREYQRGLVEVRQGKLYVSSAGDQGSANLQAILSANCFIILPEEVTVAEPGQEVSVEMIDRPGFSGSIRG